MYRTYIICLLLVALTACTKTLELPEVERDSKIALLGELVANEAIYFRAGQSVPVASNSNLKFELLHGLSVAISDDAGFNVSITGQEDTLSPYLYTMQFSAGAVIKQGSIYHVTATHADLGSATIDIPIPAPFKASVNSTEDTSYGSDSTLAIDLTIDDQAGEHYYVIEAIKQPMTIIGRFFHNSQWLNVSDNRPLYDSLKMAGVNVNKQFDTSFSNTYLRQMLYTRDINTENLKSNSSLSQFRRVLLTDHKFSGSPYNTRVYLSNSRNFFDSTSDRGRTLLQVKSVSKEYFDYLRAYELYTPGAAYDSYGAPISFQSPVKNGMGVIGGVYKQEFVFVLDEWEF